MAEIGFLYFPSWPRDQSILEVMPIFNDGQSPNNEYFYQNIEIPRDLFYTLMGALKNADCLYFAGFSRAASRLSDFA